MNPNSTSLPNDHVTYGTGAGIDICGHIRRRPGIRAVVDVGKSAEGPPPWPVQNARNAAEREGSAAKTVPVVIKRIVAAINTTASTSAMVISKSAAPLR